MMIDRLTGMKTDRLTGMKTDRHEDRQADRHEDRQADRRSIAGTQTNSNTEFNAQSVRLYQRLDTFCHHVIDAKNV